MFCRSCGNSLSPEDTACPKCGAPVSAPEGPAPQAPAQNAGAQQDPNMVYPKPGLISPGIAALLSVFIQGLGQILLGQVVKGVVILVGTIAVVTVGSVITCGIGAFILVPACIVVAAIDAYKIGVKLQSGKPVGQWEFF